jgi:hypothetical protein
MIRETAEIPTAHVDDEDATTELVRALRDIHGTRYGFDVRRWDGQRVIGSADDRVSHTVVIESDRSSVTVRAGDPVLGAPAEGPYRGAGDRFSTATDTHTVAIQPGDVITVGPEEGPVELTGSGTAFEVRTESTPYPAPRFAFLRNVPDEVAGCAEYEGAFRREVLPPEVSDEEGNARGTNRVNVHTLDMRVDRDPEPVQHCHAPVSAGGGRRVAHTETAIVLDRSVYGLPPVEGSEEHVRIFRRPREDPTDWFDLSVEPGSIVVTPATENRVYGHCFRNAFAALVAVPSFTAPLAEIGTDRDRSGETHRKYHE